MLSLNRTVLRSVPSPRIFTPSFIRKITTFGTPAAKITSLDHIVLTVHSIPTTTSWYTQHLGMKPESFTSSATPSITRHSLKFGDQKINLHELGKEFEPKAQNVKQGSADICFLTSDNIEDVRNRLVEAGVQMVELDEEAEKGVVSRTGARGKLRSVYVRDPDGNLVEWVEFPLKSRRKRRDGEGEKANVL